MFPFSQVTPIPVRAIPSASPSFRHAHSSVYPFPAAAPIIPPPGSTFTVRAVRSVGAGLTTRSSEQRLAVRLFCIHSLSSPASVAELESVGRLGRFPTADGVPCTSEGVSSVPDGVSAVSQEPSCVIDGVPCVAQGVSSVLEGVSSAIDGVSSLPEGVPSASEGVCLVIDGVSCALQAVPSTSAGVSPGHALSQPPNHALQRTEAGVYVFPVYHALLRQPLSLSLSSLGRYALSHDTDSLSG